MEQEKDALQHANDNNSEIKESTKTVLSYLHDLVCLIAAVMLIFSFCLRVVVVSGPSMKNTLYNGDCLLVLGRIFYPNPKNGDIVVISKDSFEDGTPIIKRVIATEGQTVDIDFENGLVYVGTGGDLHVVEEPYILAPTYYRDRLNSMEFPATVPEGCVFVMGDNRNESMDSRSNIIGFVDKREILGKAIFLFFPGTDIGRRDYSRIGVLAN